MISIAAASAETSPVPPAARYADIARSPRSRLPPPSSVYRTALPISCGSVAVSCSRMWRIADSSRSRSLAEAKASGAEIAELQYPVGTLDQLLHLLLGLVELLGCKAQKLDAFLEKP